MCGQPADNYSTSSPKDQRILKHVVFVRHGEGFHNLAYATGGDGHRIFDPKLTPRGISEARAVFTGALSSFKPEVAFVSPLWRTLETCTQAFAACDDVHGCPIDAMEELREHNHVSLCNHRRPISEDHKIAFPGVSFASLDVDGPPPACEWGEEMGYEAAMGMVRARAARVLTALALRPEQHIVVFTHATFIRCLLAEVLGLNSHYYGRGPPTGTPTEVLLVQTTGGNCYWRLAGGSCVVDCVKPSGGWRRNIK